MEEASTKFEKISTTIDGIAIPQAGPRAVRGWIRQAGSNHSRQGKSRQKNLLKKPNASFHKEHYNGENTSYLKFSIDENVF
jgi:hypothetical protein